MRAALFSAPLLSVGQAVRAYCQAAGLTLTQEVTEVETGTKKRFRPALDRALTHCRLTGAVLLIAKLDRLARNVHFVSGLMESGVDFVALDCPTANRFTIHILAAVAEHEALLISSRTKAALQAARARGVKLGCPRQGIKNLQEHDGRELGVAKIKANAQERASRLADILADIGTGKSLREIAEALNVRGIRTARGGRWHPASVARIKNRLHPAGSADPEARLGHDVPDQSTCGDRRLTRSPNAPGSTAPGHNPIQEVSHGQVSVWSLASRRDSRHVPNRPGPPPELPSQAV